MIPFLDIKAAYEELRREIDQAVNRVLESGWYIQGPQCQAFEEEFAAYCEAEHCVGVGNGLAALQLALLAMGVGPGDEVIVSSNTFIATWLAVTFAGATPVPVEPDARTHNLDPTRIDAAITDRTKVVLPTHLYGQPAHLDAIHEVARGRGLKVLEDAAQAHGARYNGRRIGAHSDAVAWSFYPAKNLGALGDGGAVTTNDHGLAGRVRALANYGSRLKYVHEVRGYNSRLDPLQAAVLSAKLPHLDKWNERRRKVAARYLDGLSHAEVTLPAVPNWAEPVWHQFVIRSRHRDALARHLAGHGIETLIHYPTPPHLQQAYADLGFAPGSFPIAEQLANEVLSLPMGPHLTADGLEEVVAGVSSFEPADASA